jgi:hypothetical protein
MIDFEESQTESVTVEVRYPPALSLWDDSGKLWTRLVDRYPDLKWNTALPQQQIFESDQFQMVVELEAFRVIARNPKPQSNAVEAAEAMLEACTRYLHLSALSRLGYRVISTIKLPTMKDVTANALTLLPNHLPASVAGAAKVTAFHAGLRHETETLGLLGVIRGEEREIKANFPWEYRDRLMPAVRKHLEKEHLLVFDTDYYTIGTTERESLSVAEWARQAERYIKKYWKGVLG